MCRCQGGSSAAACGEDGGSRKGTREGHNVAPVSCMYVCSPEVAFSLNRFPYIQAAHVSQLRPALGHPSKESQLTALDHQERERYKQVLQLLSAHAAAHQVGHTHTRRGHTHTEPGHSSYHVFVTYKAWCVGSVYGGGPYGDGIPPISLFIHPSLPPSLPPFLPLFQLLHRR